MMLTINEIAAAMPLNDKENSTMTAQPTGLFQGLAPLLVNRTVIMTVAADGKGLLTLNVIPKKVKDDESDALTTALCITASPEELDRDLPAQLRQFTDVHAKAASNIQKIKDELAAAEKAERESADERRAKKAKAKVLPPASTAIAKPQVSPGLFDQATDEPEEGTVAHAPGQNVDESEYPD
jgi:PRTRC genetic system protein E